MPKTDRFAKIAANVLMARYRVVRPRMLRRVRYCGIRRQPIRPVQLGYLSNPHRKYFVVGLVFDGSARALARNWYPSLVKTWRQRGEDAAADTLSDLTLALRVRLRREFVGAVYQWMGDVRLRGRLLGLTDWLMRDAYRLAATRELRHPWWIDLPLDDVPAADTPAEPVYGQIHMRRKVRASRTASV
jgi:hypothetical protein